MNKINRLFISAAAITLISSGIYGYPKNKAWKIAINACSEFLNENPDYDLEITFAVLSDESKQLGEMAIEKMN